jgi:predicted MFS family arabinose efflux permease
VSRRLTLLFAIAGGAAVGNLYWAQPLLQIIADDLHVSTGTAGSLVTATQLGYAVAILLLVSLGDLLNRRRLIPVLLISSAVALLACAAAPTFGILLGAIILLGLTTVAGQIAVPLAGDLADDTTRGPRAAGPRSRVPTSAPSPCHLHLLQSGLRRARRRAQPAGPARLGQHERRRFHL